MELSEEDKKVLSELKGYAARGPVHLFFGIIALVSMGALCGIYFYQKNYPVGFLYLMIVGYGMSLISTNLLLKKACILVEKLIKNS